MNKRIVRSALLSLAVLLVLVGCDLGGANEEQKCEPGPIPGQYIVVLADTVQDVSATAHRLANEVDGEIMSVWTEALRGFSIKGIAEEDARALRNRRFVERISPDEHGCYDLAKFVRGARSASGIDRCSFPFLGRCAFPGSSHRGLILISEKTMVQMFA